uniref:Uncharacterized protein n=1 Tax=Rhizophora mucronata TaxID=61149 RepID=A0A2P2PL18_RHIMU
MPTCSISIELCMFGSLFVCLGIEFQLISFARICFHVPETGQGHSLNRKQTLCCQRFQTATSAFASQADALVTCFTATAANLPRVC